MLLLTKMLTGLAVHVGGGVGYQMGKRSVLNPKDGDIAKVPLDLNKPQDSLDDLLVGHGIGGKDDETEHSQFITSYDSTPYSHNLTGILHGGVSAEFKNLIFTQLNLHIGMNALGEKYFSMPLYGGIELMAGVILKKFVFGLTGGVERFAYQSRLIQAIVSDTKKEVSAGAEPTIAEVTSAETVGRFGNIYGVWRLYGGGFFGYQITPTWKAILRVHAMLPLKKEEQSTIKYTMHYEADKKPVDYAYDAKHTMQYSIGMRATVGVEWTHALKKTQGE